MFSNSTHLTDSPYPSITDNLHSIPTNDDTSTNQINSTEASSNVCPVSIERILNQDGTTLIQSESTRVSERDIKAEHIPISTKNNIKKLIAKLQLTQDDLIKPIKEDLTNNICNEILYFYTREGFFPADIKSIINIARKNSSICYQDFLTSLDEKITIGRNIYSFKVELCPTSTPNKQILHTSDEKIIPEELIEELQLQPDDLHNSMEFINDKYDEILSFYMLKGFFLTDIKHTIVNIVQQNKCNNFGEFLSLADQEITKGRNITHLSSSLQSTETLDKIKIDNAYWKISDTKKKFITYDKYNNYISTFLVFQLKLDDAITLINEVIQKSDDDKKLKDNINGCFNQYYDTNGNECLILELAVKNYYELPASKKAIINFSLYFHYTLIFLDVLGYSKDYIIHMLIEYANLSKTARDFYNILDKIICSSNTEKNKMFYAKFEELSNDKQKKFTVPFLNLTIKQLCQQSTFKFSDAIDITIELAKKSESIAEFNKLKEDLFNKNNQIADETA